MLICTEVLSGSGRRQIKRDKQPDLSSDNPAGVSHDRPRHFSERFSEAYAAEITAFAEGVQAGRPLTPSVRDAIHSLHLGLAAQHTLVSGETVAVQEFGKELMQQADVALEAP